MTTMVKCLIFLLGTTTGRFWAGHMCLWCGVSGPVFKGFPGVSWGFRVDFCETQAFGTVARLGPVNDSQGVSSV